MAKNPIQAYYKHTRERKAKDIAAIYRKASRQITLSFSHISKNLEKEDLAILVRGFDKAFRTIWNGAVTEFTTELRGKLPLPMPGHGKKMASFTGFFLEIVKHIEAVMLIEKGKAHR